MVGIFRSMLPLATLLRNMRVSPLATVASGVRCLRQPAEGRYGGGAPRVSNYNTFSYHQDIM
jgi:hypothetical protein